MPVNPLNTAMGITHEQANVAARLFDEINHDSDRITLGPVADIARLKRHRDKLIRERQALLSLKANEFEAIKRFARFHGRTWKNQLLSCWSVGDYGALRDEAPELQTIRNVHGCNWLARFKLP